MVPQGLGQIEQPEQFTVETARAAAAGINAEMVAQAKGHQPAGLGTPIAQPMQQDIQQPQPDEYSQMALEAVMAGQVDPRVIMNDTQVSRDVKALIAEQM